MCNLYTQTTTQEAMRRLFADQGQWDDLAGNLPPGDVYPDRLGPILHGDGGGMVLQMARWGLPSPPQYHSPSGIDRGATNVRNTGSPHWRRWLGPEHRCLVPMTRFAEPRQGKARETPGCADGRHDSLFRRFVGAGMDQRPQAEGWRVDG